MEDRIVLDRKAFEALAAESRVKILKSLKARRKTLSELSKELDMSVSGTKEHLQNLEDAELIIKMDDGHKWKYYELTRKGKEVVGPKEIRVWILLSISTMALIFSLLSLYTLGAAGPLASAPQAAMEAPAEGDMAGAFEDKAADEAAPVMVSATYEGNSIPEEAPGRQSAAEPSSEGLSAPMPLLDIAPGPAIPSCVGAISVISIIGCLGILARNRL